MAEQVNGMKIANLPGNTTMNDTDVMIVETAAPKTGKITFLNLCKAIVAKLASITTDKLETTAKTIVGAINELNSTTANFQSGLTADGYPYAIFKESDDTFYQLTFKNNSLELGKTINGTWKTLWSSEPNSFEVSLESGFTLYNNDITVDGKIVIINFQVNGTFNADTHTKIFTVPEGYRPPCTVYCCGHSGSNGAIQVRMDNDGACYSYNSVWHTSARFTLIYRRS